MVTSQTVNLTLPASFTTTGIVNLNLKRRPTQLVVGKSLERIEQSVTGRSVST
jgi:hypothetical protein